MTLFAALSDVGPEFWLAGVVHLIIAAAIAGAMVYRLGQVEARLKELSKAVKGEGESTGLAGKVQRMRDAVKEHNRQLRAAWKKLDAKGIPPGLISNTDDLDLEGDSKD